MTYWDIIETKFGKFAAWVDEEGKLIRFNLRASGAAKLDPSARHDPKRLEKVRKQVDEYCVGKRRDFTIPLAADGDDFQKKVWAALVRIPFGETRSYGAIAKEVGAQGAARAVGRANGSNPIGLIVPCHRVIGADGSLTGYGGGLPLKRALLEHEAKVSGRPFDLFAA